MNPDVVIPAKRAHLYPTADELDVYPDVELALLDLLEPIARTVTVLAHWDTESLPAIRVSRVAGGDDAEAVSDEAIVRISCYAVSTPGEPRAAQRVARAVRIFFKRVNNAGGAFAADTYIESASKQSGPTTQPFAPDTDVRVCELIYRVIVRD